MAELLYQNPGIVVLVESSNAARLVLRVVRPGSGQQVSTIFIDADGVRLAREAPPEKSGSREGGGVPGTTVPAEDVAAQAMTPPVKRASRAPPRRRRPS